MENEEDDAPHKWKFSDLHHPIRKMEIRKTHYKCVLLSGGAGLLAFHYYAPDHEVLWAVLIHTLAVIDPTE